MNDNRMDQKKADQELSDNLDAQILELYRQFPAAQRKIVLLSIVLSATTNDEKV